MRSQVNELIAEYAKQNDLGTIVCPHCNEIIDTLPTNGVKVKYMACDRDTCRGHHEGSASA